MVSADFTKGTALYKISLADFTASAAVYTGQVTTDVTTWPNKQIFNAYPAFFNTDHIMVPILNNVNTATTDTQVETLTLMMVKKLDLSIERQVKISFTNKVNLRSVAITTDATNIYMVASEFQTFFFKFDANLNIYNSPDAGGPLGKRIFKGTTGKLNLLGAFIYKDSIFYGLGGTWLSSGTKDATVVMRSGLDYDFTKYQCGGMIIDDLRTWDTEWINHNFVLQDVNISPYTISTTVTKTASVTVVPGSNFAGWPWPFVHEAYSVTLRSISFLPDTTYFND
jgi:hypothetical protein